MREAKGLGSLYRGIAVPVNVVEDSSESHSQLLPLAGRVIANCDFGQV
jgi:hypothetical protein